MPPKATAASPAANRAAALAAAEARLRGSPPNDPTSPPPKPVEPVWLQPSEKQDHESKKTLTRMLDRGIIRDNGYEQSAECVQTLLTIATNILNNWGEAKYRTLKATNAALKTKVLSARGGHEFLIAMGFRTQTVDFMQNFVLQPNMRRMHELRLGSEVLQDHLSTLQARAESLSSSKTFHSNDEASRKERALREYEADRELVKARVERERIAREARQQMTKEAAERAKEEGEKEQVEEETVSKHARMPGEGRSLKDTLLAEGEAASRDPHSPVTAEYGQDEGEDEDAPCIPAQGNRLGD